MKKFPDDVGRALLKHIGFLVEVTSKNIDKIKTMMADKKYKCEHCEFTTDTKIAFISHMRTHGKGEDEEVLKDIGEANPSRKYEGYKKPKSAPVIETEVGIPPKEGPQKDKDGVEWYGEGIEKVK